MPSSALCLRPDWLAWPAVATLCLEALVDGSEVLQPLVRLFRALDEMLLATDTA
jgi:hypothetical protein